MNGKLRHRQQKRTTAGAGSARFADNIFFVKDMRKLDHRQKSCGTSADVGQTDLSNETGHLLHQLPLNRNRQLFISKGMFYMFIPGMC